MEIQETKSQFEKLKSSYDSLGKNVTESLKILLQNENIQTLSIYYRIKNSDSFLEKITRKSYEKPFDEIEDICGIRIICYYQTDIEKISKIINKEFNVSESEDKETTLDYNQFGYRSYHLIASVNSEWEKTPNFRGLSNLKCEIQIRTILMHAWAEIEHSLAYKTELQTPLKFRRKLHRISAKLEEADEQFEELKIESKKYQIEVSEKVKKTSDDKLELNIDTLQAFMDANFPRRIKKLDSTGELLEQMVEYNITLNELSEHWKKIKPKFSAIEKEYLFENKGGFSKWAQTGIARFVLDLFNENFRKRLKSEEARSKINQYKMKYFA